jgi:transposase
MRKGILGLAALAQEGLRQQPASGAVFAFRGRRGDRIKLLHWDGQGFCLYYKVLEKGRFLWPSPADGAVRLISAQLAMLWEGIDWRRQPGRRRRRAWYSPGMIRLSRVGGFRVKLGHGHPLRFASRRPRRAEGDYPRPAE